jgi:hypothetical protein
MKRKIFLFLFAVGLTLSLGNFEQVLACTCRKVSTCERYNFDSVIFVGKAIAIEKEKKGSFQTESTIFEIKELFSGEKRQQIKVKNKFGFSCDVEFEKDKTYLVFAGGDENDGFGTGFCSGNLPIEYADEELSNLRKLLASNDAAKLSGTILEQFEKRNNEENRVPVPNIQVNIREVDTGKTYSTFSDKTGRYEISVPSGRYKINLTIPEYAKLEYFGEEEIFKLKPRGCAESYYVLSNNSKISGKVVDSDGKPVADLRVELLSTDEKKSYLGGMSGETDNSGVFSIEKIPTGKYTLSVNYNSFPQPDRPFPTVFYPNSPNRENAKIFEVGLGQSINEIVFRLPPRLTEKEIRGEIVWEDGSPAKDVEIILEDNEFQGFKTGCYLLTTSKKSLGGNPETFAVSLGLRGSGCRLRTDESGKFLIKGFSSRKYRIKAETEKTVDGQKVKYKAGSELFSLDEKPISLKLVLKPKIELTEK